MAGVLLTTCAIAAGCLSVYRSETTLFADGSVERAIYQPESQTPKAVQRPDSWKQVTYAGEPPPGISSAKSIKELPIQPPGEKRNYFAAWGKFALPNQIPVYYLVELKDVELPDVKLVRNYTRSDYVFVVEHRWLETLPDVVTLEGMHRAREELANLLIGVFHETFEEAAGKEYDDTALVKWLQTEGKTWAAELTDYLFVQFAAENWRTAPQTIWDGVAGICARRGLKLNVQGGTLQEEGFKQALQDFWLDLVVRHVRSKKDNRPVDRETARSWFFDKPEVNPQPGDKGTKEDRPLFSQAADTVIAGKYGDEDAFEKRVTKLVVRIIGIRWIGFFSTQEFDYTLTMPGEVVETNGQVLSANRVRWRFDAKLAYPLGYRMWCRSLVAQTGEQQPLLTKEQRLDSREAMLEFSAVVRGQDRLVEALRECVKQKQWAPLYAYRKSAATDPERTAVSRLFELWKLPDKPSASQP